MNFRISIATALTMLGTVIATPALADYQLCNRTSYVLDGAIAFQEGEDWKSRGWVRLAPGECGVALACFVTGGDYPVVVGGDQKANVISKRDDILSFHFYLNSVLRDHCLQYALGLLVSCPEGLVCINNQFVFQV